MRAPHRGPRHAYERRQTDVSEASSLFSARTLPDSGLYIQDVWLRMSVEVDKQRHVIMCDYNLGVEQDLPAGHNVLTVY